MDIFIKIVYYSDLAQWEVFQKLTVHLFQVHLKTYNARGQWPVFLHQTVHLFWPQAREAAPFHTDRHNNVTYSLVIDTRCWRCKVSRGHWPRCRSPRCELLVPSLLSREWDTARSNAGTEDLMLCLYCSVSHGQSTMGYKLWPADWWSWDTAAWYKHPL